ncbi:MAG: SEC-C metal-binding domain-containing protein [Magnetococcus sp. YQC-5]
MGRIIKEIENLPEPATISLGFLLLTLSEDTVKNISRAIDKLAARARVDGNHHDLSMGFESANAGLTVHINDDSPAISSPRLQFHCERRKYAEKTNKWFGLCLSPHGPIIRFGISLCFPWIQSDAMDTATCNMMAPLPPNEVFDSLFQDRRKKTGRNEPCPCGSGQKFKRCCLNAPS